MHLSSAYVLNGVYSGMSDSALDDAYAQQYAIAQSAAGQERTNAVMEYTALGSEILSRLQSVGNFAWGLFGGTTFPKFDAIQSAIGGFSQSQAAQESVTQQATNITQAVGDTVTSTLRWGAAGAIGLGTAALIILYLAHKG